MKESLYLSMRILISLGIILLILTAPAMFTHSEGGSSIMMTGPIQVIGDLLDELGTEDFFTVYFGDTPRDLLEVIPTYSMSSLSYMMSAVLISLILGSALGLWNGTRKRQHRLFFITLLSALPDFILIMLLQIMSVFCYQRFGFRLGYLNYSSAQGQILWIPLFAMILISMTYVARTVTRHSLQISSEDYIQFARAKGLHRRTIIFRHILSGVLVNLKGDLFKLISIIIGSLFIVERMFSIPGLTRLLFAYGFQLEYDAYLGIRDYSVNFRIALSSIILIAAAALLCYMTASILLNIVKRICTNERSL